MGQSEAWRPTAAFARSAIAAATLTVVALIWRRPDLLVLATPFAVVTTWSLLTRPTAAVQCVDDLGHSTIREGDATTWRATVSGDRCVDLAVGMLAEEPCIEMSPPGGSVAGAAVDGRADLAVRVRSTRWGRRPIESSRIVAASPWAAFRWIIDPERRTLTTLPRPGLFDSGAALRPNDGLVGLHRSVRQGEGNEFAGIRAFQMGDRMRRINWIRTARSGELQVNATLADLDVHVLLIIDASDDFGVSEGIDGRASSLDSSVRAAGAIAEHYALHGERLSLRTFGSTLPSTVAPGSGPNQLRRVLDTLARIEAVQYNWPTSRGLAVRRFGAVRGHVAVMLSPLISPEALDLAVSIGRRGTAVIVIDTLPDDLVHDDVYTSLAWRIRLLERRQEVRAVSAAGIPVVRWRGPGSLDQVIRDISRRSSGPRRALR